MKNVEAAKRKWEEASKELQRYRDAQSAAVRDSGDKQGLLRQTREELKTVAVQFYLGEGGYSEDDISELNQRIHSLDDGMNTAEAAATRLGVEIKKHEDDVTSKLTRLDQLRDNAKQYEHEKKLYPEYYARAKRDGDRPLLESTADGTSVIHLRTSREKLQRWASLLGCEDDCAAFLASVEAEAE